MNKNYISVLILMFVINISFSQVEYDKVIHHLGIKTQTEEFVEDFVSELMMQRVINYEIYVNDVLPEIDYSEYLNEVESIFKNNYTSTEAKKLLSDNGIPLASTSTKKIRLYEPKSKVTDELYEAAKRLGSSLSIQIEEALGNNIQRHDNNYSFFNGLDDAYNLLIDSQYFWSSEGDDHYSFVFHPAYTEDHDSTFRSYFENGASKAVEYTYDYYDFKTETTYSDIQYPIREIQKPYVQYKPTYDSSGVTYIICRGLDNTYNPSDSCVKHITQEDLNNSPILFHNKEEHLNYYLNDLKRDLNLKMYVYKNGIVSDSTEYYLAIGKQNFSTSIYNAQKTWFYNDGGYRIITQNEARRSYIPNSIKVNGQWIPDPHDENPFDRADWRDHHFYSGPYATKTNNNKLIYERWPNKKTKYIVTKKFGTFEILNSEDKIHSYTGCDPKPKILLKNEAFFENKKVVFAKDIACREDTFGIHGDVSSNRYLPKCLTESRPKRCRVPDNTYRLKVDPNNCSCEIIDRVKEHIEYYKPGLDEFAVKLKSLSRTQFIGHNDFRGYLGRLSSYLRYGTGDYRAENTSQRALRQKKIDLVNRISLSISHSFHDTMYDYYYNAGTPAKKAAPTIFYVRTNRNDPILYNPAYDLFHANNYFYPNYENLPISALETLANHLENLVKSIKPKRFHDCGSHNMDCSDRVVSYDQQRINEF